MRTFIRGVWWAALIFVGMWSNLTFSSEGECLVGANCSQPPLLECSGSECLSATPYDLSGFDIPFAVNWPAPPVTTLTTYVSTMAEWNAAVSIPNNRIIVAPGTYLGTLNITANDLDIVMDNGATLGNATPLAGDVAMNNVSRIRWTGGTVWMGDSSIPSEIPINQWRYVTDILFDDVQWWGTMGFNNQGQRIAVINSTIDHSANAEEFSFVTLNPGASIYSDVILANVRMEQDAPDAHSTTRLQNIDRLIVVDSAFNMGHNRAGGHGPDANSTGFRWSSGNDNAFLANLKIGGRLHASLVGGFSHTMRNLTAENVERYYRPDTGGVAFEWTGESQNTGTVNNSRAFAPTGAPQIGGSFNIAPYTGSNPVVGEWVNGDPANLPDVSGVGAQRP